MLDDALIKVRSGESARLLEAMSGEGVRFAQMEIPDINGMMRGKIVWLKKALAAYGTGLSTGVMAFRSADELSETAFTSVEAGLPKMLALPDYATLTRQPWKGDTAAIICDLVMEDGSPCPMHGRQMLKTAITRLDALGLEARATIEFEVYIYQADDDRIRNKRFRELKTFGRDWDCYSIARDPSFEPLAKEFFDRMAGVGVEVEAFHTELGHGMYEFMLAPKPVLEAADDAARAKLYFKQLCIERGLVATFMPVIHIGTGDSATGSHHNLSLWRDGENALWDAEAGELSRLGRHFAGGILDTLPDFHVLFRPWVNSYRRMDRWLFTPESASWALDNHSAALRIVHGAYPAKLTRMEHRVSGGDVNYHMTLAAILLGGLHGLENEIDPGPYPEPDKIDDPRFPRLTRNLADAAAVFKSSDRARATFGDAFVDHFAQLKEDEWRDFTDWAARNDVDPTAHAVTDWEFEHYFVWA